MSSSKTLSSSAESARPARASAPEPGRMPHSICEMPSRARIADCERTIEGQQAKVGYLEVCDETLWRIENGGWWRLRGRLQPLLRLLARLRGTAQQ